MDKEGRERRARALNELEMTGLGETPFEEGRRGARRGSRMLQPMPRQPGLSAAASSPYASPSAAVSAGLLPPAALNALHAHGALNGGADLMAHGLDYSNQVCLFTCLLSC